MSYADTETLEQRTANLAFSCREKLFSTAPELDLIITTDPVHVGYLTGYRSILQDAGPYAQAAIATRDRVALITGASDAAAALEELEDPFCIWRYGTFYVGATAGVASYADMPAPGANYADTIVSALSSFDLRGARVGLDTRDERLAHTIWRQFPQAAFQNGAPSLKRARATKLRDELVLLRHASCITDKALESIVPMIRAGVTELDIAREITSTIVQGGGIPRFVVVTSGERSSRVDAYARNKRLEDGDLVRMDIGCTVNGYCSDMARTLTVGGPSDQQAERYAALLAGEQAQIAALRPGALASDIFKIAIGAVRKGALPDYQRNHCGHGIGLHSHEFPPIAPDSNVLLEPGMVFCVETPYYELGWGGMMVEDTAIITDDGHELLTHSARELCQDRVK
ncbi:Xaa-Pro peptidase family protein [Paraburkholderia sprentiae WSM5005]|uniref:Xaa-Pro peptidase family protein n=1 Tax=Paraburkholderia sprentiae WSM5005 TaxID=754502 RepID=A0A1I9YLI9_9BURK|nr:Xaa-Pro peptidase family protein [Paraburkholderia sprentiae]APA87172.1 Xaa-Pro peptidase family protein [Paraburkholderia sprentiae WSM5005]APA87177.1 Xaa-Pro peptidase family protein [Paraburkholderia sprentiae WSM5005]